jgi:hypothetical protein
MERPKPKPRPKLKSGGQPGVCTNPNRNPKHPWRRYGTPLNTGKLRNG